MCLTLRRHRAGCYYYCDLYYSYASANQKSLQRDFLAVQWLRLHTANAGAWVQSSCGGTKRYILNSQKERKEIIPGRGGHIIYMCMCVSVCVCYC